MRANDVVAVTLGNGNYAFAILLSLATSESKVRFFKKQTKTATSLYNLDKIQTIPTNLIHVSGVEVCAEWSFIDETCIKGWRILTTPQTIQILEIRQELHYNLPLAPVAAIQEKQMMKQL